MGKYVLDREAIKKIIPHKEPMLFLDCILKTEENKVVGAYTVKGDEGWLIVDRSNTIMMPHNLVLEVLGQTGATKIMGEYVGKSPLFSGFDGVENGEPARPGDRIIAVVWLKNIKEKMGQIFGSCICKAYANNKLVIKGIFNFVITENT